MTTRRSEGSQGGLFEEEPKPNSPDDLGFGRGPARPEDVDRRPPEGKAFGDPSPGPDPVPQNVASGTIQIDDARKFVAWIHEQDLPVHADVTVGHVLVGLSGLTPKDLGWLCRAFRQAGRVPAPWIQRRAVMKQDVGLLRKENEPQPEETRRTRQKD